MSTAARRRDFLKASSKKRLSTLSPEWQKYNSACKELDDQLTKNLPLSGYALDVYYEVKKLARHSNNKIPIKKLAKVIETTTFILRGPHEMSHKDEAYKEGILELQQHYHDLRSFPAAKVLASALLCLLGVAIVAASGILAAVSFGLSTPISLFGMVFGASIVHGGVAIIAGAIGSGCLFFSGPLLASGFRNKPVRNKLKELRQAVKQTYRV